MRLPKDFKGPRKVPNYTADQPPEAWVESYEMAMEMLDVDEAACAKYFTMMLEGTARTWLKNLPANSVESWDQLKARFIANFKDTCKQPMSIVDLEPVFKGRTSQQLIGCAGFQKFCILQTGLTLVKQSSLWNTIAGLSH